MNIQTALNILGFEPGTYSAAEIKKAYKAAAMKYHPDRNPAGAEMMKAVFQAWEMLKDLEQATAEDGESRDFGSALNDALNAIINCTGLDIEICGSWVWVSGDTLTHKDALKGAGYRWANAKKMWYFRDEKQKRSRRGGAWDMDKIRDTHGSDKIKTKQRQALKA